MWNPPVALTPEEQKMAARTRKARKFFVFLRARRHERLDADVQNPLATSDSPAPGGKAPVEAGVLALATLWQASCHVGDRDAGALTVMDKRWQRVLDGLGTPQSPGSPSTLWNLRLRLSAHNLDKVLLERTVALAEQTGGCGPRQLRVALASTPLCGAGRVEDTLNLLGHARRKAVGLAAQELGTAAEARGEDAGLARVGQRRLTAALDLDWGEPKARENALGLVLEDVERWQPWLEQPQSLSAHEPPMQEVLDPIAQGVTPDPAPDPEGGPGGRRIKQHVAPARRSAIEDQDRRHGRQSSAKTFHGCKAHFGLDLDRKAPRAVVVRPANEPEYAVVEMGAEELASGPGLLPLDSALGSLASPRMAQWAAQGVDMSARPWPQGGGLCTTEDCPLDCAPGAVTCPNGPTVPRVPGKNAQCPASACETGAMRTPCTTASMGHGRSLTIREDEPCQQQLRATINTKRGRASRRQRTAVAQAISHPLAHQGRRARDKGLRKNQCDGRRHAAVSNLQVAAQYEEEHRLAS